MGNIDCWHEAAHAALALAYGGRVTRVAVGRTRFGDREIAGVCIFIPTGISNDALAQIYLAGPVMEKMMSPSWDPSEIKDDYERAGALVSVAEIPAVIARARCKIESLSDEIDRLAIELLQFRELDEGTILRAIKTPLAWLQP